MKSREDLLGAMAIGILADVQSAYPEYGGVDRDCERLSLLVRSRGLGLFTLDLPNLDDILLKGIETGRLVLSGPLSTAVSKRIQVPRLFRGLWLRVFGHDSCLLEDPDPTAIAFLRQLSCLGKKIVVECTPSRLRKAQDEYIAIEAGLLKPSLRWNEDGLFTEEGQGDIHLLDCPRLHHPLPLDNLFGYQRDQGDEDRKLLYTLQLIADEFSEWIKDFDPVSYSNELSGTNLGYTGFRHGPGAVADIKGRRGSFDKFSFPNWPLKLQTSFPFSYCGLGLSPYHGIDSGHPSCHEPPSRLIAVPKTAKSPRLIAAEPTAHQWCQQLILHYLIREIRRTISVDFIDLSNQSKSQEMVVHASLHGDLATVDLSSASDRLTCWVVERIFRRNPILLSALHSSRTRWIKIPRGKTSEFLYLKKFASQGTAVTFPIQSIVFLLCALASLPGKGLRDRLERYRGQVRVFGDDIIIPTTGYASLSRLLDLLQLKVNKDKSFSKSLFRESCGQDSFKGYDVTPIKPKQLGGHTPEGWTALLALTNNLFCKGYWNASRAVEMELRKFVPGRIRPRHIHVVGHSSGASGLISFTGGSLAPLSERRWNKLLHRYEVRSIRAFTTHRSRSPDGSSQLRRFFFEGSRPDRYSNVGLALTTPRISNYPGWEPLSHFLIKESGPKPRPKGVGDGQQVEIPVPPISV